MFSIAKNMFKILAKRKSFIFTAIIMPIFVLIGFSILFGSNNTSYKVALVNKDNSELSDVIVEKIKNTEGITIVCEKDLPLDALVFHEYEALITIEDGFQEKLLKNENAKITINSVGESDVKYMLKGIVDNEVNLLSSICTIGNGNIKEINNVIKEYKNSDIEYTVYKSESNKNGNVGSSLGMVAYCIFINGSIGASFILEDERRGTKDRILLSKHSEKEYYGAIIMVLFSIAAIPCFVYYAVAKGFNMEFNMENTVYFLLMLLLIALLSVSICVLLSTVIKRNSVLTSVSQLISLPAFMLSGGLWDFHLMSEGIQKIGNMLPPRWIFYSIIELGSGATIVDVLPQISAVLLFIIVVFLLSGFLNKMKIVLVKYN